MAAFQAYFDDSGTHDGARYTVVAGAVGSASSWKSIEAQWGAVLKRYGVATFRSSQANNRRGEFEKWEDAKRDRFTSALLKILSNERSLRPVSAAVKNEEFNKQIRDYPSLSMSPYQFCSELAVLGLGLEFGKKNKKRNGLITVTFESGQRTKSPYLLRNFSESDQTLFMQHIGIGAISFVPYKSIPLQVADLFAYEVYKALNDNVDLMDPQHRRFTMLNLLDLFEGRWIGSLAPEPNEIRNGLQMLGNNYELAKFKV